MLYFPDEQALVVFLSLKLAKLQKILFGFTTKLRCDPKISVFLIKEICDFLE
jgi:hypothetical protein